MKLDVLVIGAPEANQIFIYRYTGTNFEFEQTFYESATYFDVLFQFINVIVIWSSWYRLSIYFAIGSFLESRTKFV
ncbi:hypothetical protein M0811_13519 [Anaeramoeba ignava]|uniref:Uncharacterized protein n=1 Tax=Anaeramoeba ignava TaxID=1746090 RepID=A0A9Q0R485_ANAIG|nr:hypothetical protein M0811_13519 [Anaeramoeba ignava]